MRPAVRRPTAVGAAAVVSAAVLLGAVPVAPAAALGAPSRAAVAAAHPIGVVAPVVHRNAVATTVTSVGRAVRPAPLTTPILVRPKGPLVVGREATARATVPVPAGASVAATMAVDGKVCAVRARGAVRSSVPVVVLCRFRVPAAPAVSVRVRVRVRAPRGLPRESIGWRAVPVVDDRVAPGVQSTAVWEEAARRWESHAAQASAGHFSVADLAASASARAAAAGWTDPEVRLTLSQLWDLRGPVGWGLGSEWDAFADGTPNPATTMYTITTAQHVGRALLDGWRAGVVPDAWLRHAYDAVVGLPVAGTGRGCYPYSDSQHDLRYCVVNVNLAAARFVRDTAVATGWSTPEVVSRLGTVTASIRSGYDARTGFWPYRLGVGRPQDPAHNAFTAITADELLGGTAFSAAMASTPWFRWPGAHVVRPGWDEVGALAAVVARTCTRRHATPGNLVLLTAPVSPGVAAFTARGIAAHMRAAAACGR